MYLIMAVRARQSGGTPHLSLMIVGFIKISGQGNFSDDQMPNHGRLGSETATAVHFAACRKQHSLSPKRTLPLLPS